METFNFKLTTDSSGDIDHKVNETSFGDGYVQASAVGINNKIATWAITAIGKSSYTRPIMNFIDRHQGFKSFYWTPPEGEQGRYRVTKYKLQNIGGNNFRVTATFSQGYGVDAKAPTGTNVLSVNGETPDEYGDVELTAEDIGADAKGTASKAIEALKKEENPFTQYALAEKVPDLDFVNDKFKEIDTSLTEIDTDVANLQTELADTNEYVADIHTELETVSGELFGLKDGVTANTEVISNLKTKVESNEAAITNLNTAMVKSVNGVKPDPKTGDVKIETGTGGVEIDDEKPSTTTVYSGSKTDELVTNLKKEVDKKAVIDDTKESATTTYSSKQSTKLVNDKFTELANLDDKDKGAALVGYSPDLDYPDNTVGNALKNSSSGLPLFSVLWWPSRSNVPAGYVLADGQELSSLTYPDAAEAIQQAKVPIVSEEEWQSTPIYRGCYVSVSSADHFRLPDYNGIHGDSLGALFLRGDNGQVANGNIQLDELRSHTHSYQSRNTSGATAGAGGLQNLVLGTYQTGDTGGEETRPINVSGCWVIKLFGVVTNVGNADAAQLASDYANLASRTTDLENWKAKERFKFIYPNGGTEENPANVEKNNRYIMDNPFPNEQVICLAEIYVNGVWGQTGFIYSSSSSGGFGTIASQVDNTIIIQTGSVAILATSRNSGSPHDSASNITVGAPCRIKVWRVS